MAKKFVRKDTDIRWIQEIRDWTNDIGDILVKDDRYAYVRTYGEYKPISFPMIWDYKGIPKNEITKTDYFVDKTGVHKLDKKKNTTHKYDLTDGSIEEKSTVADDDGEILTDKETHQTRGIYDYKGKVGEHLYDITFDNRGYNFESRYTGNDSELSRYYRFTNNSDGLMETFNLLKTNYSRYITRESYSESFNVADDTDYINTNLQCYPKQTTFTTSNNINGNQITYNFNINSQTISSYLGYNLDMINFTARENNEYIAFSSDNGVNYEFGLKDGLFYTNGTDEVINSLKNYYDNLLGVTAKYNDALNKIANLQNQINDLQTQINNIQK